MRPIIGSVVMLTGCGSGDGAEGDTGAAAGTGSGTVTGTWAAFCTGTFTADTNALDSFGDVMFTAQAGQEYLLTEYSETTAEFAYLTDVGPEIFEVDADASGAFPFTSNCAPNQGVPYYAVFTDVSVYAEEALMTKICELTAGTVLPAVGNRGFAAAGGFSLDGPAAYQIFLDAFSAGCGGAESGYISVPETVVFGTHTWLVPIIEILGPE